MLGLRENLAPVLKSVTGKIDEYRTPNMRRLNEPASRMLGAMHLTEKHVYGGTVDPAEVRRRRLKNKVARRTRAAQRKARR